MLSFGVLIVEIWLFAGIGLLLHRANPRFGLTPILFYVSALVAILNFAELLALHVEPTPGIVLRTGAHVFVPIILMLVLVLYVSDGTQAAQLVVYGLAGINVLIIVVLVFILIYQNVYDPATMLTGLLTQQDFITLDFLRGAVASVITFMIDMYVIVIVYQGIHNAFPKVPRSLTVGAALTASLWTDAIVFNLLYFLGTENLIRLLPGDVLAKTLAALLIWPMLGFYMVRIAPLMPSYVGGDGRPMLDMVFGTFGRITRALEQSRAEYHESQVMYRQLSENVSEIFWMAGAHGRPIYYLNPAFEVVTGRSRMDVIRQPELVLEMIHPEDRDQLLADVQDPQWNARESEFRIVRPDGEIRCIRSRVFWVKNQAGQISRLVGLAEDITERRQAEQREQALTLEQQKVRLLREFIHDASHDLKSPLTTIKLKVSRLRQLANAEADAMTPHLDELDGQADYLSDLIDDLFHLSQLEGRTLEMSPQNLHQILHDLFMNLQPLATRKNLDLRLDLCAEDSLMVLTHRGELSRALSNLISNGIRYTERGWIEVRTRLQDGQAVLIEVADSGIGIDEDEQKRIFERFYRAQNAKQAQIEGTGLGLAIVKAVVDQHGGSIEVESAPSKGTTFRVRLPLVESKENQDSQVFV